MGKFNLNKSIAEFIFPDSDVCSREDMFPNKINPDAVQVIHELGISTEYVDYCNNWNDLMPLVVEYKISLEVLEGHKKHMWIAGNNTYHRRINANPQRALAECLLKVLQENPPKHK